MRALLGRGSYGVVLLVDSLKTETQSALKMIWKERFPTSTLQVIRSEANILWKLVGKSNIVQIKNVRN